jgi:hypothetical protein
MNYLALPEPKIKVRASRRVLMELQKTSDRRDLLRCPDCMESRPMIDDVTILLPTRLRRDPYPGFLT